MTDEKTFELFVHLAWQNSKKYSLLVTLKEESFRYGQGSNEAKKKAPNLAECDIPSLESILEGENLLNTNNGVETHVLPKVFGSRDIFEMEIDMPSPKSSHYVSFTSPSSFLYVAVTMSQVNINGQATESQGN